MDVWRPPAGEPELLAWWRPLLLASRRVRLERVPWQVHPEEFELVGRFLRNGNPDVWVYVHDRSGGEVLADVDGRTYEFIRYKSGRAVGRFKEISARSAVWRARLPEVVDPEDYDEPLPGSPRRNREDLLYLPEAPTRVTRVRHLRLVSSQN